MIATRPNTFVLNIASPSGCAIFPTRSSPSTNPALFTCNEGQGGRSPTSAWGTGTSTRLCWYRLAITSCTRRCFLRLQRAQSSSAPSWSLCARFWARRCAAPPSYQSFELMHGWQAHASQRAIACSIDGMQGASRVSACFLCTVMAPRAGQPSQSS